MNCLIYLFDGFELFELSAFTDIFGWNNILNKQKINFLTTSHKKNINSMWGGNFLIQKLIYEIDLDDYDILIIPGGFGSGGYFKDNSNYFDSTVKHFVEKNKKILAICTASLKILKTSFIKNICITTYTLENRRYFNQLFRYDVQPIFDPVVIDNNIYTCSGPYNAIELAFKLISDIYGENLAENIKKNMMF